MVSNAPTLNACSIAEQFVSQEEGLRLAAYICPAGKLTIGYGHTGDDVFHGMAITPERAGSLLQADLGASYKTIERAVSVPLTDNQMAALASFVFNLGAGAFLSSTLLKKLNQGDYQGAADQLPRWCHAHVDGQLVEVAGLKARRNREKSLFLTA